MVITYHGGESIKAAFGDTVLAFNPISKDSALKPVRFGADVALVSLNHPDMNGVEQVAHAGKEPFVVSCPGEYEVKKTIIKGFPSVSRYGAKEDETRLNTIYYVELEGMQICFLGALCEKEIPEAAAEAIEHIDILFVPIGGGGVLSASDAHALSVTLEPNIIIPIHYGEIEGKKQEALTAFLKEEGAEGATPVEKLTVKKKDAAAMEGEVVVLAG